MGRKKVKDSIEPFNNIVRVKTGEIIGVKYENQGITIYDLEADEESDNSIQIKHDEKQYFIKFYSSVMQLLTKEGLTGTQWSIITCMLQYLRYDSGLVSFRNGPPVQSKHIATLLDIAQPTVCREIDKLVNKNIIDKDKDGRIVKYYVNPFIFSCGTTINEDWYNRFSMSKWNTVFTKNHNMSYTEYDRFQRLSNKKSKSLDIENLNI